MSVSFDPSRLEDIVARLRAGNEAFQRVYPGEPTTRQPLHTVYGGAHLFKTTTAAKLGQIGLRVLKGYTSGPFDFARILGLPGAEALAGREELSEDAPLPNKDVDRAAWLAVAVYRRVVSKLTREPVEDFRIDFEDGFGNRPDGEEDDAAVHAAEQVAQGLAEEILPPFIGIRIKPFTEELRVRAFRTLDLFMSTLLKKTHGRLPANFVVTLPKVTIPEQVAALADLLDLIETTHGTAPGSTGIELMIETTQAIMGPDGGSPLPAFADAARGRCRGAHFGTYDFTATSNITAEYQAIDHPVCDLAKMMMQMAYSSRGIFISDGATTIMPIAPHRGAGLTDDERQENRTRVHDAWKLAYHNIVHALRGGFYQGWDLHPGQLPIRYAATFAFFLDGLDAASARLSHFIAQAAQASLVGSHFDDAATGQGLLNTFLRALNSGAITLDEVQATGLTLEEIQSRSFVQIVARRRVST